MSEYMKPHEVAQQLNELPFEIVEGRVESERLGEIITRSQAAYLTGSYEANEYGHVTIDRTLESQSESRFRVTTGLIAIFNDPTGRKTELGGIRFVDDERRKATAIIRTSPASEEPLLPEDYRWDAIVGTISRAVDYDWQHNRVQED